jgi:hypothetical protein
MENLGEQDNLELRSRNNDHIHGQDTLFAGMPAWWRGQVI